jgi:hypothetical protein
MRTQVTSVLTTITARHRSHAGRRSTNVPYPTRLRQLETLPDAQGLTAKPRITSRHPWVGANPFLQHALRVGWDVRRYPARRGHRGVRRRASCGGRIQADRDLEHFPALVVAISADMFVPGMCSAIIANSVSPISKLCSSAQRK